jgi:hypothetical protein
VEGDPQKHMPGPIQGYCMYHSTVALQHAGSGSPTGGGARTASRERRRGRRCTRSGVAAAGRLRSNRTTGLSDGCMSKGKRGKAWLPTCFPAAAPTAGVGGGRPASSQGEASGKPLHMRAVGAYSQHSDCATGSRSPPRLPALAPSQFTPDGDATRANKRAARCRSGRSPPSVAAMAAGRCTLHPAAAVATTTPKGC